MKIVWEEADIRCGRRVFKEGTVEKWMIGYRNDVPSKSKYVLISMSDGMICKNGTKDQITMQLNAGPYLPEELESNP